MAAPDPFQNSLLGTAPNSFGGSAPPSNALMPPSPYDVTPAQGWAANGQAAGDWLAGQRAQSAQMGFLDPNTGLPTRAGVSDAAGRYTNMLLMGVKAPGAVAQNALMPQQPGPLRPVREQREAGPAASALPLGKQALPGAAPPSHTPRGSLLNLSV